MASWRLYDLSNWHQINELVRTKQGKKNACLHCFTMLCWLFLNDMLSICILFEIRDFVKHQIKELTRHSSTCMRILTKKLHFNVHSDEMRKGKTFPMKWWNKVCQKAKENTKIQIFMRIVAKKTTALTQPMEWMQMNGSTNVRRKFAVSKLNLR